MYLLDIAKIFRYSGIEEYLGMLQWRFGRAVFLWTSGSPDQPYLPSCGIQLHGHGSIRWDVWHGARFFLYYFTYVLLTAQHSRTCMSVRRTLENQHHCHIASQYLAPDLTFWQLNYSPVQAARNSIRWNCDRAGLQSDAEQACEIDLTTCHRGNAAILPQTPASYSRR
jgi:hypothetical protein